MTGSHPPVMRGNMAVGRDPSGEDCQKGLDDLSARGVDLMNKGTRPFGQPKGAFPEVLRLLHESIAATFAERQRIFLKDLFFKHFRIGGLNLIDHPFQLMVDVRLSLQNHPIKVGEDPDLSHIRQASR